MWKCECLQTLVWCFFTESRNNLVFYYLTDLQKQTSYSAAVIQDFLLIQLVIHTVTDQLFVNITLMLNVTTGKACLNKLVRTSCFVFIETSCCSSSTQEPSVRPKQTHESGQASPRGQRPRTTQRCLQTTSHVFLIVHVFSSSQSSRAPLERSPEQLKQHDKVM